MRFAWSGLLLLTAYLQHAKAVPSRRDGEPKAYDFIIVGGGTAGLAVASRISQGLSNSSVLVIEAGPDGRNEPNIYIPGKKGSTLGTKYDWNFTTVAQENANDRVLSQNRGKVLGGSSALNLMTWDRTTAIEIDAWEKLGNDGWNWDNLYPAMLKCETFLPSPEYTGGGVGHTGPIQTLINRILPEHQYTWIPTMNNLGLGTNNHSLDGHPIGVMRQPTNIRASNYTRSYSPEYLNLAGSNLDLMMDTRVAKINFLNKTASGVTLENGTIITAKKEVILSAGSFQSPGLLELSGIGQASRLSGLGIKQVSNLTGVGENLQDHIRIQNSYQLKPEYLSFDILRFNTTYATMQLALYNMSKPSEWDYTGSGYAYMNWSTLSNTTAATLTTLAQNDTSDTSAVDKRKISYLSSPASATVPQLEVIFSDGYTGVKGYPLANSSLYGTEYFSLIAAVQHPLSRGSVHINTTNITSKPVIDPNYLSHPYDLAAAITATKFMREIANTAPMSSVWVTEYEPGPAVQTDAQWETYAKNNILTIYHPVGTCAMMPQAMGGVVSPELKVYGVEGLRVVDASVIPILPSAHIQTVIYGIAERAAEMVVKQYS